MVTRHQGRLRAFLARLGGRDRADELAQDTFLRAWIRAGDYRGSGSYAGWLYRIAWHLFLDQQRANNRRLARETHHAVGPDQAEPDAESMIDAQRLLGLLDERSRAALLLCDGYGWSHSKAAAMLDIPLGTLKSLIGRAKLRLREAIRSGNTA